MPGAHAQLHARARLQLLPSLLLLRFIKKPLPAFMCGTCTEDCESWWQVTCEQSMNTAICYSLSLVNQLDKFCCQRWRLVPFCFESAVLIFSSARVQKQSRPKSRRRRVWKPLVRASGTGMERNLFMGLWKTVHFCFGQCLYATAWSMPLRFCCRVIASSACVSAERRLARPQCPHASWHPRLLITAPLSRNSDYHWATWMLIHFSPWVPCSWMAEKITLSGVGNWHQQPACLLAYTHSILAGGLEHVLFVHILGISSSQLTFTCFRGLKPPTRYMYVYYFQQDQVLTLGKLTGWALNVQLICFDELGDNQCAINWSVGKYYPNQPMFIEHHTCA